MDESYLRKRPRIRRSAAACTNCRRRKVRCNLMEGSPCTNCRLDGCECLTTSKKRPSHAETLPASALGVDESRQQCIDGPVDLDTGTETCTVMGEASNHGRMAGSPLRGPIDTLPQSCMEKQCSDAEMLVPFAYFPFFKRPNMSNLQPADIAYLDSQKCLHVPAGKLLETLVSHYFLYVHPCLPIVNEAEFWTKFRQREDPSPTFSLLVFQAMLFAASSYIPLQKAKESGAESILRLRDRLYRRAKLLCDFGLEDSHEDICQASVLLSYYCSKPDPLSNTTWLAVAIQHARAINAHLYHRYHATAKHRRTKLKRIWWSLIIRDRVIALGMRRSLQILPTDFDLFSHPPLALEDVEDEFHASEVYDAHTKTVLCKVLTSQCQLAVALTPLLMTVYPGAGLQDLRPDDDTTWRRVNDSMARLRHWEKHHMVQISHDTGAENPSIPFFHHLTALYYETARLALYHHIFFCLSGQQSLDMASQKHHPDLIDAIATINKTVKHFIISGTAGWLPISAVAYTIAPQIVLNINLRLVGNPADRRRQENLLRFYTELSRVYHLRYDVTYISSWIQQIVGIFDALTTQSRFHLDLLPADRSPKRGFNNLIAQHPAVYLDLVSLIDHSMSKGRVTLEAPHSLMLLPSIQERSLRSNLTSPLALLPSTCQEQSLSRRPQSDTTENLTIVPNIPEEQESECIALQQPTHCPAIRNTLAPTFTSPELDFFSFMPSSANPRDGGINPSTRQEEQALLDTSSPAFDQMWADLGLCGE